MFSISPSSFSCFTHPCCSVTVTSRPFLTLTPTRSCRTYLSQKRRACASPHEQREVWLSGQVRPHHKLRAQEVRQDHLCGQRLIDDPDLNEISEFSKNTHENTGLFCVFTMFESSVSHISRDDFALEKKANKACIGKPIAREREEGKRRFCDQCCEVDVKEKNVGTILGIILFRLSEKSFLMDEISENILNEELNELFLVKIQFTKVHLKEHTTEIQRRNSEYTLFESQRELECQGQQLYWKPIRPSSAREKTFVLQIGDE